MSVLLTRPFMAYCVSLLLLAFDNFGYLRHVIVEVASASDNENVEVAVFHEVQYVLLVNHTFIHAFFEIVVYKL